MKPTIVDVAKRANVAVMTASRVMNGHPRVRPRIRERVLTAAEEIHYVPNLLARGLRRKALDVVSLLLTDLPNPYFGTLADRLSAKLRDSGLRAVLCDNVDDMLGFNSSFSPCASVLVLPTADHVNRIARERPAVTFQAQSFEAQHAPDVSVDRAWAYAELAREILAGGRRKVTYCCAPSEYGPSRQQKFRHVETVLEQQGLEPVILSRKALESSEELARLACSRPGSVDTVFCENDVVAAGVLCALHARGVRSPEDVLVIGCDGTLVLEGVWTVVVDFDRIAREVVDRLLRQLNGEEVTGRLLVRPELVTCPV